MGELNFPGVDLTPLPIIQNAGGNILHVLKASDPTFAGFGEAYFSLVELGAVKAWKKHNSQISNLVVPVGRVSFVIRNDDGDVIKYVMGEGSYCRLTVPAGFWFGFKGLGAGTNLVLNISNLEHNPAEADRAELSAFNFDWESEN